jgi:hypothetical protein
MYCTLLERRSAHYSDGSVRSAESVGDVRTHSVHNTFFCSLYIIGRSLSTGRFGEALD